MVRYPEERAALAGRPGEHAHPHAGRRARCPSPRWPTCEPGRGYASIKRVDRRRAVNVTADVDPAQATPGEIIADLEPRVLPEILADHPGVIYTLRGRSRRSSATPWAVWPRGFALALLMIYALLAIPLRSYVQPLVIMSAIPFGLVGAVWGHVIMGMDLTILSMFGARGADRRGGERQPGDGGLHQPAARQAPARCTRRCAQAGVARFRPILLTSLTTFCRARSR